MKNNILNRVLNEAEYIVNNKKTVRDTAEIFKVSKSTVHKDMQDRLKYINTKLYKMIQDIFSYHKEIRHINGGKATKIKYLKLKNYKK